VMGGGFPMAAYVGKEEIMRMVAPVGKVYQAGTYSGNPVSVAAGLAVIELLREKGKAFYAELERKCLAIVEPLVEAIYRAGLKLQVNHVGSMFQLFFAEKPVFDYASTMASSNSKFMEFHAELLRRGVFLAPSQFETCFLSDAHSAEDLKRTVECFLGALQKVM